MNGMFQVDIKLGNDAMRNGEDIAQALERIARYVRQGIVANSAVNACDKNGNQVGLFIWRTKK